MNRRFLVLGLPLAALTYWIADHIGRKKNILKYFSVYKTVVDIIVPEDDIPGGLELGIINKVVNILMEDQNQLNRSQILVQKIQTDCIANFDKPIDKLGDNVRTQFLLDWRNNLTGKDNLQVNLAYNFDEFRNLVLEQYYLDPTVHRAFGYLHPSRYPAYKLVK